ncbi:MAG: hypothetical protein JOZ08_10235 [Verrucomicrobia bacterium]|nr:hypothetical protein [Verrucomicrobiota bacterium]
MRIAVERIRWASGLRTPGEVLQGRRRWQPLKGDNAELDEPPNVTEALRLLKGSIEGDMMIEWEDYEKAEYYVGKIGPAKFEINSGVGGMFGATFSFAGDCYAILSTAKTVAEAKRFCEWLARGYGLDRVKVSPASSG